jgi:hypothetical protein
VAALITFTTALARVRQHWGAQVSPSTTVGQVAAAVGRAARLNHAPVVEAARPARLEDRLDSLGIQPGDRLVLVDHNDLGQPAADLSGVRGLSIAWPGGSAESGGRARLSLGASQPDSAQKPDLDLRGAVTGAPLPLTCGVLAFESSSGGWSVTRTGDARLSLDDFDLPPGLPVMLNLQSTLWVAAPGSAEAVAVTLTLGELAAGGGALPVGSFELTAWLADESRPLTLRASLNLPLPRLVGGLASQFPYPAGGHIHPYVLRLIPAQARLTDLGAGVLLYAR